MFSNLNEKICVFFVDLRFYPLLTFYTGYRIHDNVKNIQWEIRPMDRREDSGTGSSKHLWEGKRHTLRSSSGSQRCQEVWWNTKIWQRFLYSILFPSNRVKRIRWRDEGISLCSGRSSQENCSSNSGVYYARMASPYLSSYRARRNGHTLPAIWKRIDITIIPCTTSIPILCQD